MDTAYLGPLTQDAYKDVVIRRFKQGWIPSNILTWMLVAI